MTRAAWIAAGAGLAGSMLVALAAPVALADPVVAWWYAPRLFGPAADGALVWIGMGLVGLAWLALGRALPPVRALIVIAIAWTVPLALAPPLFSRDIYSYLAQGTIMHLGHSPYTSAPRVLAALGRPHVLAAVSPFWRGTTAPYGPLFLGLVSLTVGAIGSHLVAGVLLVRGLGLLGLVVLLLALPRLTRALGSDLRRAIWLLALSPLTLLQLIAAGHNDLLMAGLLAAGLALAVSGRPLIGIAVCALAATIKVPALAAGLFIAVAWIRAEPDTAARVRVAVAATLVCLAVLVAVSAGTGTGPGWLSTSLFATPARVRLAITPATAVGDTIGQLLRAVGVTTTGRGIEAALGLLASAAVAGLALGALVRVRVATLVGWLGLVLAAAAAGGPAAWPWYFIWSLVCAAALPGPSRWRALPWCIALSAFLVKPNGILAVPLGASPIVLLVLAAGGAIVIRRRRRPSPTAVPSPAGQRADRRDPALSGS